MRDAFIASSNLGDGEAIKDEKHAETCEPQEERDGEKRIMYPIPQMMMKITSKHGDGDGDGDG